MKILSLNIYLLSIIAICTVSSSILVNAASSVTYVEPGTVTHILPEVGRFGYNVEKLNVFCYKGGVKDFHNFLQSIILSIDIDSDDFTCFSGSSPKEVQQAHDSHRSIFSFNWFSSTKKRVMNLNPYNKTCIGVQSAEEYRVSLEFIQIDNTKVLLLISGVILFFLSSSLSHNSLFFYLTGVALGNVASLAVLIWFISKLFPRKPLMYGALATGWTLVAYLGQILFQNVQSILMSYQRHVLLYIFVTSFVSFCVCYYKGPPKKKRSKDLIKWTLQFIGLALIFFSTDFKEAAGAVIVGCFCLYYFPLGIFNGLRKLWRRRFPEKRKLLTREEFEDQGRIETEKALNELREFLKSPQCKNQWSLVKNLSQPVRFASFVEGEAHVTLDETVQYDSMLHTMELSDDSDEMSDDSTSTIEGSIAVNENFDRINKSKIPLNVSDKPQRNVNYNSFKFDKVSSSTPRALNISTRPRRANSRKGYSLMDLSDDDE